LTSEVNVLLNSLENIVYESCDIDIVNKAANDICNVKIDAATSTFGSYNNMNCKFARKENKPWFDHECMQAKKLLKI
jgi:hypothetical protein